MSSGHLRRLSANGSRCETHRLSEGVGTDVVHGMEVVERGVTRMTAMVDVMAAPPDATARDVETPHYWVSRGVVGEADEPEPETV